MIDGSGWPELFGKPPTPEANGPMSTITTHLVNTTAGVAFARHRAVHVWCTGLEAPRFFFMSDTKHQRLREPSLE